MNRQVATNAITKNNKRDIKIKHIGIGSCTGYSIFELGGFIGPSPREIVFGTCVVEFHGVVIGQGEFEQSEFGAGKTNLTDGW